MRELPAIYLEGGMWLNVLLWHYALRSMAIRCEARVRVLLDDMERRGRRAAIAAARDHAAGAQDQDAVPDVACRRDNTGYTLLSHRYDGYEARKEVL